MYHIMGDFNIFFQWIIKMMKKYKGYGIKDMIQKVK